MYRSMCVSFLFIHFYLHPERVKDGQFSNAFAYMYSYFLLKIFTRFDTFRADNTREIQHESRRKAGGNLHLRSAVVDLRVQLVGTFTFLFVYICAKKRFVRRSFSLSFSLCSYVKWNSNREPLFILFGMGSKLYPRCCVLYAVRVGAFAQISTDTNKCSSFLPLFRAINAMI